MAFKFKFATLTNEETGDTYDLESGRHYLINNKPMMFCYMLGRSILTFSGINDDIVNNYKISLDEIESIEYL